MPDASKSLDILIRTRGELEGAIATEKALERDIGKAKALGQEFAALEDKLKRVRGAMDDYKKSQAGEVETSKQIAQANEEIAAGVVNVGEEDVKAALKAKEGTEKLIGSKTELRHLIGHLGREFPILGQIGRAALNPLVAVIASLVAGWEIWKYRIDEATKALGGVETPDNETFDPRHINNVAKAWDNFATAVREAGEQYHGFDASIDRTIKKLNGQYDQLKKVLEANKALELSELEKKRSSISEGDYETGRLNIEDRYSKSGLSTDEDLKRRLLAEKQHRGFMAGARAKQDLEAAQAINTGDDDADEEARLLKRADAARKAIEERRKKIKEIVDLYDPSTVFAPIETAKFIARYGIQATDRSAISKEQQGIDASQTDIDRYNTFLAQKEDRAKMRTRRDELTKQASKEQIEANQIAEEFPEDVDSLNQENAVNRKVAATGSLTRANQAAAQANANIKQVSDEIAKVIESGRGVSGELIRKLQQYTAEQTALAKRVANLEGASKSQRIP